MPTTTKPFREHWQCQYAGCDIYDLGSQLVAYNGNELVATHTDIVELLTQVAKATAPRFATQTYEGI